MMPFFTNKTVVVTGGTDGIGRALVELLINRGAKVAACGRSHDKLYRLQTSFANKSFIAVACDVSNEGECAKFIETTVKTFGGIDILINNAGISMRALFNETSLDTLRRVMDINFWGAVYCTKYALPYILKNKGTVAGISSIAGYRGLPGRSGYSASKHALQGWLEALRTEMLDSGVNVMWVCPGFTTSNIRNTALNSKAAQQGESPMDEGNMMSAEECATYILQAIEKRKRTVVLTGQGRQTIFMNRFFPGIADKLIKKFFLKNGELIK